MDRKPVMRGAVAGSYVVGALLLGVGVGAGIGNLVGAVAPFVVLGVFAGFGMGIWVVYKRFSDI